MKLNKKYLLPLMMVGTLLLGGCSTATDKNDNPGASSSGVSETAAPTAGSSPAADSPAVNGGAADVVAALNALTEQAEQGGDTYERDYFNHWVTKNATDCDTRFAVLVEESTIKAETEGCKVISGNWVSSYDNETVTDPKTLDIDHMVPLKEAWESGASTWDDAARETYANDMDYANSLVAVTASSNRAKSAGDPAEWLPTNKAAYCDYAANWIQVKTKWKLTVDTEEKSTLLNILQSCDSGMQTEEVPVSAPEPETAPPAVETPAPAEVQAPAGATDPDMGSCKEATAAGYGPYSKGDPEYEFYRDTDGDGSVCE